MAKQKSAVTTVLKDYCKPRKIPAYANKFNHDIENSEAASHSFDQMPFDHSKIISTLSRV